MNNERVEVFIYVNKIDKDKASYGIYLKYYDKHNLFIADKKISSKKIEYKNFTEEIIYHSLIDSLNLIKNKNIKTIVYCSYNGNYPRCRELTKLVKKFYRINFIFNYEDETAKLISKENTK